MPGAGIGAELGCQFAAVQLDLETSGSVQTGKVRHPIARSHPDRIGAGRGKGHRCRGVDHRHAHAVGENIRRTHLLGRLGVHLPPSKIVERLRLDQHG